MDSIHTFQTYRTSRTASKPQPINVNYHFRSKSENPKPGESQSLTSGYPNLTISPHPPKRSPTPLFGNWSIPKTFKNCNFKESEHVKPTSASMASLDAVIDKQVVNKHQENVPFSRLTYRQKHQITDPSARFDGQSAIKTPSKSKLDIKSRDMRHKSAADPTSPRPPKRDNVSPLPRAPNPPWAYEPQQAVWNPEHHLQQPHYVHGVPPFFEETEYPRYPKHYEPSNATWPQYPHQKKPIYYPHPSPLLRPPYNDQFGYPVRPKMPRSAGHSKQPSESFPQQSKVSKSKSKHKKVKSKSNRMSISMRDYGSNDHNNLLITPTFVPGMPMNSGHIGPPVCEKPPGGYYWAIISRDDETSAYPPHLNVDPLDRGGKDHVDIIALPIQMCEPPLKNIVPAYPHALEADPQPRNRKQSKYTPEQDELILKLKNEGKSWAEIASKVRCQNQLAARNRYQVLIGQQGGGTFFWSASDCAAFQSKLDESERAKWLFIAEELSKKHGQKFTIDMVHYKVCEMFAEQSERFGVIKTKNPAHGGAPYKRKLLYRS